MNTVQPHNVRTVDTTVGELEPGTIFRPDNMTNWLLRSYGIYEVTATYLSDGMPWFKDTQWKVVEIADSVTIEREVT